MWTIRDFEILLRFKFSLCLCIGTLRELSLEEPEEGRMPVPLCSFLARTNRLIPRNLVALILFQSLLLVVFLYCAISNLFFFFLSSFVYVGVWSVTSISCLEGSGWLSEEFQMLQFWLACKLSRTTNLLHVLNIFIWLVFQKFWIWNLQSFKKNIPVHCFVVW